MDIGEHVAAIEHHLSAIADTFAEPTAGLFTANAAAIRSLEQACNLKADIDAAIAYAADKANAGDRVGSSRTVDYLMKELGLSFPEAQSRLKLGHHYHGRIRPPDPEPEPEPEPEADDTSEEERRRAEEERHRAAEERRRLEAERIRRDEEIRARAREQARKKRIGPEKLGIVNRELDKLNDQAAHLRHELFGLAITEAHQRLADDLREWIRNQVIRANRNNHDPHAAFKNRKLTLGRQDADGGATLSGYLTGDVLALMEAALAPARTAGHLVDDPSVQDTRSITQRRHDALGAILKNHSAKTLARTGVATVVVSMSAKDIDEMTESDVDHRYPTNTSAVLTPGEILRLGATKYNYVVVHDSETGNPLNVGRTERLATVEQRIALLATQLVCTDPDCTAPFCECEIHHIKSWQQKGETDIWNLAALCRPHHGDNRDERDGRQFRGHAERDPVTQRVGKRPPGRPGNPDPAVRVNNTERQEHSGGAKVRNQPWPDKRAPTASGKKPGTGEPPSTGEPFNAARATRMGEPTPSGPSSPPTPVPSFDEMPPGPPPPHLSHEFGTSRPRRPMQDHSRPPPEQPPLFPLNGTG